MGYQWDQGTYFQLNLFSTDIEKFIGYDTSLFAFRNLGEVGTEGIDVVVKFIKDWGSFDVGYSHYWVANNEVASLAVEGDRDMLLGIPDMKLNVNLSRKVGEKGSLNINYSYIGERYGCVEDFFFVCGVPQKFSEDSQLDFYYLYVSENWEWGLGVQDASSNELETIQPYTGGYAPIKTLGRRYQLSFAYHF